MKSKPKTIDEYFANLPEDRWDVMNKLRQNILDNLPAGFKETIQYGMPSYVVPHSIYPDGYHCDPKQPLPFLGIASQKNFVSVYHMGIYASPALMGWFTAEYPKHCKLKLDMGKSCIRFKNMAQIPFELIGELISKMSVEEWIGIYESNLKR